MPPRPLTVSSEFTRISELPRRKLDLTSREAKQFAGELSEILRAPGGRQTLKPIQAVALYEWDIYGGLIGALPAGAGKTLVAFLASVVMATPAKRPCILMPSGLREPKRQEMRDARRHWTIPNYMRILGYGEISVVSGANLLREGAHDILICDEAQLLKNLSAAVTKRVRQYLEENPGTRYMDLSGTTMDRSIKELAHRAVWALGAMGSPLPNGWAELSDWAIVLDGRIGEGGYRKLTPGPLLEWCEDKHPPDDYDAAKRAWRDRAQDTPGVIMGSEEAVGASIQFRRIKHAPSAAVQEALQKLREEDETPDGWSFEDAVSSSAYARQLALGFYYRRTPWPPPIWIEKRKAYSRMIRHIVKYNRRELHSPLQVKNAIAAGDFKDWDIEIVRTDEDGLRYLVHRTVPEIDAEWQAVKGQHELVTKPTWICDSVLERVADWARESPGLVWCEHIGFARELARRYGFRHYGAGGVNASGEMIEDADNDSSIVVGRHANFTGRNLQYKWWRNLIVSPFPSASVTEQKVARTHRQGQRETVVVDFLIACDEAERAIEQIIADAKHTRDITGNTHRVLYGDWV